MPYLDQKNVKREWFAYLIIFLIVKISLLFSIPLLDDEAYFISWGRSFDLGYYDHPPMIGWITGLISFISSSHLVMRIFPLFTILVISLLIYRLLKNYQREKAKWISLLFFMSVSSVMHVPALNDTALLLFGSLSLYHFLKDTEETSRKNLLLCCLFMSLAFMAKYFAAFLGIVYLITYAFRKPKRILEYLLWTVVFVSPALAAQFYWNYENCWNNIMFNVINRHSGKSSFELFTFLATIAIFLNPAVFWYSLKLKPIKIKTAAVSKLFWLLSLTIFGLISLKTLVGAHWVLVFLIPPYLVLAKLKKKTLVNVARFSAIFSLVFSAFVFFALNRAEDFAYSRGKDYSYYQHFFHTEEVCKIAKENIPEGYTFMADGYSPASVFSNICGDYVPVIFHKGVYGRQSDSIIDFREFDGKNIAIYSDINDGSGYEKYFESVERIRVPLRKADVKILLGKGFKYEMYKENVLLDILNKFYKIPDFLPYGKCYFHDKYFPEAAGHSAK